MSESRSIRHQNVRDRAKRGQDASNDNPLGIDLDAKLSRVAERSDPRVEAALRGREALQWARQSDPTQAEEAEGGRDRQIRLGGVQLRPYSIPPGSDRHTLMYAAGEGATRRTPREMFDLELMPKLETGDVGLVLVTEADRITRNMHDGLRFVEVCKRHNIMTMVQGRALDANNPAEEVELYQLFNEAARDSVRRTRRLTESRVLQATKGRIRNNLPTGLVHADPTDPAYEQRLYSMAETLGRPGLKTIVNEEQLAKHDIVTEDDGQEFYILPFPDPDVHRGIELIFEWLFECGSLTGVLERIRSGYGEWPADRAGQVPMFRDAIFHHSLRAKWRKASKSRVRRWLRSEALYGIYCYESESYADLVGSPDTEPLEIRAEGAFPGFRPPEDYDRVQDILSTPRKRYGRHDAPPSKRYKGARNYALPHVTCAHPVDGTRCGLKMGAQYERDGQYRYMSTHCEVSRDHGYTVSPAVESVVIDIVLEALDPEQVTDAVQEVQLSRGSSLQRVRRLRARLDEERGSAQGARSLAVEARKRADDEGAEGQQGRHLAEADRYRNLALQHEEQAEDIRKELEELEAETEKLTKLADQDIERIRDLAGDLERLIGECRPVEAAVDQELLSTDDKEERLRLENYEGRVRAVLEALRVRVRLRPLDEARVEVSVVFPRGDVVRRTVPAQYGRGSQVERLWAWHQTRMEGRPAEEVVPELGLGGKPGGLGKEAVWTPGLVRSAAFLHERAEPVPEPTEATWSVRRIAGHVGESEEAVFTAALKGDLGPGRIEDGRLLLEPSEGNLDDAFPEYARENVARSEGWPLKDTRRLTELADARDVSYSRVRSAAKGWNTIARDRSGRVYCRRGRTPLTEAEEIEELLRGHPEEIRELDRECWTRVTEARKEFPYSPSTIMRKCDHVITYDERSKGRPVWVYLDEAARNRLEVTTLEEAAEAEARKRKLALDPADFVTRREAQEILRDSFSGFHNAAWYQALDAGDLVEVEAQHPSGSAREVHWVWCPDRVLETADPDVARQWFEGGMLEGRG